MRCGWVGKAEDEVNLSTLLKPVVVDLTLGPHGGMARNKVWNSVGVEEPGLAGQRAYRGARIYLGGDAVCGPSNAQQLQDGAYGALAFRLVLVVLGTWHLVHVKVKFVEKKESDLKTRLSECSTRPRGDN